MLTTEHNVYAFLIDFIERVLINKVLYYNMKNKSYTYFVGNIT